MYTGSHLSSDHRNFRDLHDDIQISLQYDETKQQNFFFEFQFRIFVSLWDNLKLEDQHHVKSIAMNFYDLPMSALKARIDLLITELPKFILNQKKLSEIDGYIELLHDTDVKYHVDDYTFGEAVSLMPEDLNFPEALALEILNTMGYTRENVERVS